MAIQNIDEAVKHLLTYNAKTFVLTFSLDHISRKYRYLYKIDEK